MRGWAEAAFDPRRVAVVGASSDPGKLGNLLVRNLLDGFAGDVVPVNPRESEIAGRPTYPSVSVIPDPVDLVLVAAPPQAAPDILRDCAAAGVPVVTILSGGFAESGKAGRALQDEVVAVARQGGVRVIGPNCFGLINVYGRLNASLGLGLPRPGGVSLVTQSGAYGMAAFSRSKDDVIGFAKVLAPGNKVDVDEVDVLGVLADDPQTRVVALLLESVGDGGALFEAIGALAGKKPVVVLKTGRSASGHRAAASHTAALADDHRVTRAALAQAGAHLVEDGLTLLDVAAALDRRGPLGGRRVGIITNSGGTGVELTDLLSEEGLEVPRLSEPLQRRLAEVVPPAGSTANPIDVTTLWKRFPEMYRHSLRALLESTEVDAVIPVLLQRSALDREVTRAVIEETTRAAERGIDKPVHGCWVAPSDADANRRRLLQAGIPCHRWPLSTARVLARCLARPVHGVPAATAPRPRPVEAEASGWLDTDALFALLANRGLPVAPWRRADDADAAAAAAVELGFPVVLKRVAPGLVHKTEAGAIHLDLADRRAVRRAAGELLEAHPTGHFLVQAQVPRGVELLVGATRDPRFGPVVAFGLGGVWVEALDDVALRVAPFDVSEALELIGEIRGQALLDGARGGPAVDRDALARLLSRFSIEAARSPWCAELELNPLIARQSQLTIVDARLRVTEV